MRKRLKGWRVVVESGGGKGMSHAWFTRKIRGRDSKSVITVRTSSYPGSHPIRQKGWEPPLPPSNGTRGEKKTGAGMFLPSPCHEIESSLFFPLCCFSCFDLFLTLARKGAISVNDKNSGLRANVPVFLRGLILSRCIVTRGEVLWGYSCSLS